MATPSNFVTFGSSRWIRPEPSRGNPVYRVMISPLESRPEGTKPLTSQKRKTKPDTPLVHRLSNSIAFVSHGGTENTEGILGMFDSSVNPVPP